MLIENHQPPIFSSRICIRFTYHSPKKKTYLRLNTQAQLRLQIKFYAQKNILHNLK